MNLNQIFLELLERGKYIPVALKEKAKSLKLIDKIPTVDSLNKLGIKGGDQLIFLSASLWLLSGIGFDAAIDLYNNGIRKSDLKPGSKNFDKLPEAAQLYIIYKPLAKIKNKDIPKYVEQFIPIGSKEGINYDIVGSYRRSTPFSRDIDILWYEYNTKSAIHDSLSGPDFHIYSKGPDKLSGIFISNTGVSVKIDVWLVHNKSNKASMKLYATGSKMFNIRQRIIAKKMGYKLNQMGLFNQATNRQFITNTEEDIFKLLKMKYKEPSDRH
jgi:hypothetical protein